MQPARNQMAAASATNSTSGIKISSCVSTWIALLLVSRRECSMLMGHVSASLPMFGASQHRSAWSWTASKTRPRRGSSSNRVGASASTTTTGTDNKKDACPTASDRSPEGSTQATAQNAYALSPQSGASPKKTVISRASK